MYTHVHSSAVLHNTDMINAYLCYQISKASSYFLLFLYETTFLINATTKLDNNFIVFHQMAKVIVFSDVISSIANIGMIACGTHFI